MNLSSVLKPVTHVIFDMDGTLIGEFVCGVFVTYYAFLCKNIYRYVSILCSTYYILFWYSFFFLYKIVLLIKIGRSSQVDGKN